MVSRLRAGLLFSLFLNSCTAHHSDEMKTYGSSDFLLKELHGNIQKPLDHSAIDTSLEGESEEDERDLSNAEGRRLEKVIKADVIRLLVDHGFPKESVPKMVCTARFESNFSAFASNYNRNGTMDTGLFQINDIWLKACNVSREDLLDPEENTRCAYTVFKKQGMKAWVAYKRKRSYCHKYKLEPSLATLLQGMYPTPRRS
jgi:hypothetical protein